MPCRTRAIAMSLLVLTLPNLTGCTTWHPVTTPAAEIGAAKSETIFRVYTKAGPVLALRGLRVVGDSVSGVIWNPGERPRRDSLQTMALADIRTAERMGSGDGTAAGVLFLLVLAGVAISSVDLGCVAAFCQP
jgi:hypothetical protein